MYLYLLAYALFPCLSQDGGTYLGERYLVLKVPSSSQARVSFNKSVVCCHYLRICLKHTTRDHFPVARSGRMGNRTAFIVTPPPFKKPCGLLGKKPKVIFLLHKSLLIYFPPLVAFQGLLQRKHELLRSD